MTACYTWDHYIYIIIILHIQRFTQPRVLLKEARVQPVWRNGRAYACHGSKSWPVHFQAVSYTHLTLPTILRV